MALVHHQTDHVGDAADDPEEEERPDERPDCDRDQDTAERNEHEDVRGQDGGSRVDCGLPLICTGTEQGTNIAVPTSEDEIGDRRDDRDNFDGQRAPPAIANPGGNGDASAGNGHRRRNDVNRPGIGDCSTS